MAVTIEVDGTKKNTGSVGGGEGGTVTVNLVLRSSQLGRLPVALTVPDHMDQAKTMEAARAALLQFAEGLLAAAQHPLQ